MNPLLTTCLSLPLAKRQTYCSILSELVQNADDAGAKTVRIMLNSRQYGDGSLLGPAMSSWQGPSLYVYNDAVFTGRDFQNLAKIGQVPFGSITRKAYSIFTLLIC